MKTMLTLTAALFAGTMVQAEGMIDTLCGPGHVSETAGPSDVRHNPDGYYVASLQTQLSHGDPRIVHAVGETFHLCTRPAATPDMETTRAILLMNERVVSYLFVPTEIPTSSRSGI